MFRHNSSFKFRRVPTGRASRWDAAKRCALLLALAAVGCEQWMGDQPRYEPLESSSLIFRGEAGRARWDRQLVAGTVPRGATRDAPYDWDEHFLHGTAGGQLADELPEKALDERDLHALLVRGRERYGIFCAPCHDLIGAGNGRIPQRGFPYPPSFHGDSMREKPLGHYFRVISDGMGRMPPYRKQIPPADRWAITAYIRALQLSQHAPVSELPESERQQIEP